MSKKIMKNVKRGNYRGSANLGFAPLR